MQRQLRQHKQEAINTVHQNIHAGLSFSTFWKNEDGSEVADNGVFGLVLLTGSQEVHLTFGVAGGGDTEAILYEDPTLSVTGTPRTIYNLDRTSGAGSSVTAWHSPTITTGTVLTDYLLPGGLTNTTPGGMVRADTERVLRTGTFYALAGVNRAGDGQPGSIMAQWYEDDGY